MAFITMDFIDLQEKEGKGFNCEQLLILCVIAVTAFESSRTEVCSPRLTAGTE